MLDAPKRPRRLAVALPGSFTKDIPHMREKTGRVGLVARALAIFRVDEALIYNDTPGKTFERETRFFEKLLVYLQTPPYLRRTIFSRDPDLQFAGILPPLRLPSHPDVTEPRPGQVREALVLESGSESSVNAGYRTSVRVASTLKPHERVTIRLTSTTPHLEGEVVDPDRLPIYWGFRISRTDFTLGQLIEREKQDLTISTSRNGRVVREVMEDLRLRWKAARRSMVVFGSPSEGVPEILARERVELEKAVNLNLNMIPHQGVETVRTEEALVATLSVLNLLEET